MKNRYSIAFAMLTLLVLVNAYSSFFYGFGMTVWLARFFELLLLVGIGIGFKKYQNKKISLSLGLILMPFLVIFFVFAISCTIFLVFSTPITRKQDGKFAIKREPKLYIETICADFALFETIGYVFDRKLKYFVVCDSSQEKSSRSKKALPHDNVTLEPKSIKPNDDKTSFQITFKRLLRHRNVYLKDTIVVLKID